MKKDYKNNRVRTLKEIAARHAAREIKGFHSWRHFAVHQDRAWLLNALDKLRNQADKIRQAKRAGQGIQDAEVEALLKLLEEDTLDRLGD